jgi:hypothetical protein
MISRKTSTFDHISVSKNDPFAKAEHSSPDPSTKKKNSKNSKSKKTTKDKAPKPAKNQDNSNLSNNSHLGDLPSLGGPSLGAKSINAGN